MVPRYTRIWRRFISLAVVLTAVTSSALAQWTTLPSLNGTRSRAMNAYLNGYIYTFGGYGVAPGGSAPSFLATGQKLKVSGGVWENIAPMPSPLLGGYAAVVNGKIYVMGGGYNNGSAFVLSRAVWVYDPVTNAWSTKNGLLPKSVIQTAGAVEGSNIYIIGGLEGTPQGFQNSAAVQVYDVINDSWTEINPAPYAGDFGTAVNVGGTLYLVGGRVGATPRREAYRGVINGLNIQWAPIAQYPVAVSKAAAGVSGGKLYVVGGESTTGEIDKVYSYNTGTNKWEASYPLPTPISQINSAVGDGTSLYMAGGETNAITYALTPGAAKAIASLDREVLTVTVKKGEFKDASIVLSNNGILALTGTVTIPGTATWLMMQNPAINVQPGSSNIISFRANSGSLDVGTYSADITIATNDADRPSITVKVKMYVVDANLVQQETRVLVEEGTGNWCGYCPDGHRVLDQVADQYGDKVIFLGYHGGSQNEPFQIPAGTSLMTKLNLQGWPNATINRWQFPGEAVRMTNRGSWAGYVGMVLAEQPMAPVAIEVESYDFNATTKKVTARVKITVSEALTINANTMYHLTAVVSQDSMSARQTEYTANGTIYHDPYYNMEVVRTMWPDEDGQHLMVDAGSIDDGVVIRPGTVIMQDVSFTANTTKPAISHIVFIVHKMTGGNHDDVLQAYEMPLTGAVGGGGGYAIETKEEYLAVTEGDTAIFTTTIKNNGTQPMDFSVARIQETLPDNAWKSWFCFNSDCSVPGSNDPIGPYSIAPGQTATIKAYVMTKSVGDGSIKLQFRDPVGVNTDQLYRVSSTPGSIGGVDNQAVAGNALGLSQNNPNPASAITHFNYTMPKSGVVTVEVYSLGGESVLSIPARMVEAGSKTLTLDVSSLPSGTYSVRVTANGSSAVRQMTVAR